MEHDLLLRMPSLGEFDLCIKCNKKDGNLLFCNSGDCPIVVHDKCMPASSHVSAKFYCPFCLTRDAYAQLNKAREDALLKSKALASFIHATAKIVDGGDEPIGREKEDLESVEETERRRNNSGKTACNKLSEFCLGADGVGETSNKLSKERNNVLRKRKKVGSPREPRSSNVECSGRSSPIIRKSPRSIGKNVAPDKVNNSPCESPSSNVECSGKSSPIIRKNPRRIRKNIAPNEGNSPCEPLSSNFDCSEKSSPIISKSPRTIRKIVDHDKVNTPCEPVSFNVDCSGKSSPAIRKSPRIGKNVAPDKVNSPCEFPSSNVDCCEKSSPIIHRSPRKISIFPDEVNIPCKPISFNVDFSGKSSPIIRRSPRKTTQTNSPIKVSQKILFPDGRRKKLLWTEEEVEMIKKGVEKFASEHEINMPWRKILEFGRHTFHCSRMPGDLKDKWRNMLSKENSSN